MIEEDRSALDVQVGGDHYKKCAIQPVQFAMANNLNGLEYNVVKRITRWRDKGGYEDLRKIKHEVDLLIEMAAMYEDLTTDGKTKPELIIRDSISSGFFTKNDFGNSITSTSHE